MRSLGMPFSINAAAYCFFSIWQSAANSVLSSVNRYETQIDYERAYEEHMRNNKEYTVNIFSIDITNIITFVYSQCIISYII